MRTKMKANWSNPATTAENEKLPGWLKWVWSGKGVAYTLNFLLMAQISYYCTDMLGMSAGVVGVLLLVSKIFDAFTDLMAGYIIDHTNTRWGKARPYDIFVPLTWVCTILLFSTPDLGPAGKCIYVFCLYSLTNAVCNTFASCGDSIYMKRAIRSEKNWTSVTAFQGAITMLFSISVSIFLPTLIATVGAEKSGWTIIALCFGVPLAIIGSLRMLTVKEIAADTQTAVQEKAAPKVTFKETVFALSKNKLILIIGVIIIVYQITSVSSAFTYYFKWIFGNIALGSLLGMASLVTPILLIFVPALTRKLGTTRFLILGMFINLLGCIIRMIFATNIVMLMISNVLTLAGMLPVSSMLTIYVLECMDYGQKKTGVCIDGVTGAFSGFATKVGSSLGSGLMGLLLGAAGYISDPAATSQPDSAIRMIYFLFVIFPLILGVITFLLSIFYKKVKKEVE